MIKDSIKTINKKVMDQGDAVNAIVNKKDEEKDKFAKANEKKDEEKKIPLFSVPVFRALKYEFY